MPDDAQVRVLRFGDHEFRSACDLCGPLTPARTQAEGVEVGRTHLQREHAGGSLAISFAPPHYIPPPIDTQLDEILERLQDYLRDESAAAAIPHELMNICSDLLEAGGRWLSMTPSATGASAANPSGEPP